MSDNPSLRDQAFVMVQDARDIVGEFIFQPFGIESSDAVNGMVLSFILVVGLGMIYRAVKPAPQVRHRAPSSYDYGRNV